MTENIATLLELIDKLESDVKKIRAIASKLQSGKSYAKSSTSDALQQAANAIVSTGDSEEDNIKVVEGIFDGYFMIGSDTKKYPVPMNYSSKSKLVQGDQLKLRIMADGALKYKVTKQIDRKFIKAVLVKTEDGKFQAVDDNKKIYNLNQAAVTFFSAQVGDEVSLIIATDDTSDYAAIEAVMK